MKGQRQHLLIEQHIVVPGDNRLQLGLGPGLAAEPGRSSAYKMAMKWLLPEPNDPARNAPRLTPDVSASAISPSAASNASASAGVTTYSFNRAGDLVRLDAVRQPQHVILGTRLQRDVEHLTQQLAHPPLSVALLARRPRAAGAGRHAASSSSVLPTWAARAVSCSRQNAARLTP